MADDGPSASELLLYTTEDGETAIEARLIDETVWLSADQMADLFQRDNSVISRHIRNVYNEGELGREGTVAEFATVQNEGGRRVARAVNYYNLDVIISVGYRVKSLRGTQFRIWATQRLREYLVKGFLLNDDRFKRSNESGYFEELLARIRDIRSSEKVFYRKVLDLFATSIDYQPDAEETRQLFATAQNKLHWAAHQHTAAEIVSERSNAASPNMGLTSWAGPHVRKSDIAIAKNYLTGEELETLNRLVTAYLDIAELQALARKVTTMGDWLGQLDKVIQLAGHTVLEDAGSISMEQARTKAALEYEVFHRTRINGPSRIETDFDDVRRRSQSVKPPDA